MLEIMSKLPENIKSSTAMPNDIVEVIKTLEANRLKFEEKQPLEKLSDIEQKARDHMDADEYGQALVAFQTFFENAKLDETPIPDQYRNSEHFCVHFEEYSKCLLRFDMYDEALEFLHMGLQKIRSVSDPNAVLIESQEYLLQLMARVYCTIGDYKKSAFYVSEHGKHRKKHDVKKMRKDVLAERFAFTCMKMCLHREDLSEEKVENLIQNIHSYFELLGSLEFEIDPEFNKKFLRMFVDLTIYMITKIIDDMKKEYTEVSEALWTWTKLKILYESRQNSFDYFDEGYQFDILNNKLNATIAMLLAICHHQMNRLWKKMDKIFPEHENHKLVTRICNYPGVKNVPISKVYLNKDKSEIDAQHETNLKRLLDPPSEFYGKILNGVREMKLVPFVCNNWKVLSDLHPGKKEKSEKKKWRMFKNSSTLIMNVRERFNQSQIRKTDEYQKLSSWMHPHLSYSDISDSE